LYKVWISIQYFGDLQETTMRGICSGWHSYLHQYRNQKLLFDPGQNRPSSDFAGQCVGVPGMVAAARVRLGWETFSLVLQAAWSMRRGPCCVSIELSRVAQGGHDIPEQTIRQRYIQSRLNLIRLLPTLTELLLYDNSEEADPRTGTGSEPSLVLPLVQGKIRHTCRLELVPERAKPILAVALKLKAKN
jgi:hypothetical protein